MRDAILQNAALPAFPPLSGSPFVSVIVLNCNGESVLADCLEHLKRQSYPHFEIIIFDNGSTDQSLEVLTPYLEDARTRLVRSETNLGVAGGRNAAIAEVSGEVVAFIDNDGYADKDWLAHGLQALFSSNDISAVGSLVFFNRNKLVLNGAGGSQNRQWYAADKCFNEPLEFALLPTEVLYPMGCGMLFKRAILTEIGKLDDISPKWFDDTEMGIRTWLAGKRVVLGNGFVDHDFHTSEKVSQTPPWKQALSFERMRIRMALKYEQPAALLLWLISEVTLCLRLLIRGQFPQAGTIFVAHLWNLLHLPSALRIRFGLFRKNEIPRRLIEQSWGHYPPSTPRNHLLQLTVPSDSAFRASDPDFADHLHFGWFDKKLIESCEALPADKIASLLFLLSSDIESVSFSVYSSKARTMKVRPFGTTSVVFETSVLPSSHSWASSTLPCSLKSGLYEVLLLAETSVPGVRVEPIFALSEFSFQ